MVKKDKKSLSRRALKTKNIETLKKLALAIVITVFAAALYIKVAPHTYDAKQRVKLQKTIQQLENTKSELDKQQTKDAQTQQKLDETNKQLQETQKQLEAKRNTAVVYAAPAPKPISSVVAGCGDNTYANYIYMHESGCNTSALNSIGCRGIGQACPGGKLPCDADYACQNAYFSNYAISRYGSWEAAYNFWQSHRWW